MSAEREHDVLHGHPAILPCGRRPSGVTRTATAGRSVDDGSQCAGRLALIARPTAQDGTVLIFLLLGWAPWPLLLALAIVMWLTVVELLEWRPHYVWWFWWLLARVPHALRRLPLPAGIRCLPTAQARPGLRSEPHRPGTSGTGLLFRIAVLLAVLAVAFVVAEELRVGSRTRSATDEAVAIARKEIDFEPDKHQVRYLPQGIPPRLLLGRDLSATSTRRGRSNAHPGRARERDDGQRSNRRERHDVANLHNRTSKAGLRRTWNAPTGGFVGLTDAPAGAASGGRGCSRSVCFAARPRSADGRRARSSKLDLDSLILTETFYFLTVVIMWLIHVGFMAYEAGRRAAQEHHVDGDEEHPHHRRRHADVLLLRLVHLRLLRGGLAEERPRRAPTRVPGFCGLTAPWSSGHGPEPGEQSHRASEPRLLPRVPALLLDDRARSCPARSSSACASPPISSSRSCSARSSGSWTPPGAGAPAAG